MNDNYSSIRCQTINANNFELKPALISMVQQAHYSRSPLDDPNIHLTMFLEICDTVKINGVTEDTIRLRLFPFSSRDKARVNAASSGTLMLKTAEGATSLLKELASNNYQWPTKRTMAKKVAGIHELESFAALSTQVASLSHQISVLTTQRIPQSAEYVVATGMNVLSNEAS
ncbi:uncharacterized protein LOC121235614 [Juglans microcarpa x Juglans regia]|uniref:uncharacterized protein LOC121235614 n=1 Tax=Juglans microcarpa x Juglans regia TaxID=2249226 RepID=UPI001B7E66C0|nr:uncharacterized protein LOC121235614 [Juglans microcarpa x Juglans regia]